jgi:hypothetical protein
MTKSKTQTDESIENLNYTTRDLTIDQIVPNVIDNFIITILDGHHTVVLPPMTTGIQFKNWSHGRGGIFSKDVLHFSLNQNKSKYLLLQGSGMNCVIRLIEEEELLMFKTLKLIDGELKDRSYMILKKLQEGEKLTSTIKYVINEKESDESDYEVVISSINISRDEDTDYHANSISLFTE